VRKLSQPVYRVHNDGARGLNGVQLRNHIAGHRARGSVTWMKETDDQRDVVTSRYVDDLGPAQCSVVRYGIELR
jgi:hypothetical protein